MIELPKFLLFTKHMHRYNVKYNLCIDDSVCFIKFYLGLYCIMLFDSYSHITKIMITDDIKQTQCSVEH